MTRVAEFTVLIRELQHTKGFKQCAVLKNIAVALQEAKYNELQELLELLTFSNDVDIQTKLFSVLAVYLINNGEHYEVIVKYNPLYDTLQNLLVGGSPMKMAVALNFVTALLAGEARDGGSSARTLALAAHARNMIRVSGCLNTIATMFSGSMMYQDTWIALCQSLSEACRDSETNQNYCSHLVLLCVNRCRQGNVDVCAVLQSLLQNHERNLQLFIEIEGLCIFTRSVLQYNMGMQLLNTIVERSPVAVSMLRSTDTVHHLRDFVGLYGPSSQIGQWSIIILYHLGIGGNDTEAPRSRSEIVKSQIRQECSKNATTEKEHKTRDNTCYIENTTERKRSGVHQNTTAMINTVPQNYDTVISKKATTENEHETRDNTHYIENTIERTRSKAHQNTRNTTAMIDIVPQNYNTVMSKKATPEKEHETKDNTHYIENTIERKRSRAHQKNRNARIDIVPQNYNTVMANQDDTAQLFQNVIKEVLDWKSKEKIHAEKPFHFNANNQFSDDSRGPNKPSKILPYKMDVTKRNYTKSVQDKDVTFSFLIDQTPKDSTKHHRIMQNRIFESIRSPKRVNNAASYDKEVQTDSSCPNSAFYSESTFRPLFISTPKRNRGNRNVSSTKHQGRTCIMSHRKSASTSRPKAVKKSTQEKQQNETKETKHRSMSERFFSVINESCTTIVKGVKNIFKTKNDEKTNENNTENLTCNYSFTNYMRERDALLEDELSQNADSSSGHYNVSSCKTCKDTIVLQQKMKRSDHLKQTIRKLKMGIHLYGCDFKRISCAMWPRDRYLTPDMLKNLYRKLIVKGGHDNHSFRLKTRNNIRKK